MQCEDEKLQLEERNTVIIFQRAFMVVKCDAFGCTYSCKSSPGLSSHRISATNAQNKLLQQRWMQNIHPFCVFEPFRKRLLLTRP